MTGNLWLSMIESQEMPKRMKAVEKASNNYHHQQEHNQSVPNHHLFATNDPIFILKSKNDIIMTHILEVIGLQMIVTMKRLPPLILGAPYAMRIQGI
jgi:hypothetical protein